jgi:hypothetical protein
MIKGANLQCDNYKFYSYSYLEPIDIPVLMHSAWQASDGTKASVIANYLDKKSKFVIDLSAYGGGVVYDSTCKKLLASDGVIEMEIEPLTAYIVKYGK